MSDPAAPEAEPLPPLPEPDVPNTRLPPEGAKQFGSFSAYQMLDHASRCAEAARAPLLARIEELEAENADLRNLLDEAHVEMKRARVFIGSRERMHEVGRAHWDELLARMDASQGEEGKT